MPVCWEFSQQTEIVSSIFQGPRYSRTFIGNIMPSREAATVTASSGTLMLFLRMHLKGSRCCSHCSLNFPGSLARELCEGGIFPMRSRRVPAPPGGICATIHTAGFAAPGVQYPLHARTKKTCELRLLSFSNRHERKIPFSPLVMKKAL